MSKNGFFTLLAGLEEAAQVKADWMASISRDVTTGIGLCRMTLYPKPALAHYYNIMPSQTTSVCDLQLTDREDSID